MDEITYQSVFRFYEEILISNMRKFSKKEKELLIKNFTPKEVNYFYDFYSILPESLPFDLKVKTVRYNLNFFNNVDLYKMFNINKKTGFKIEFAKSMHIETPNMIAISNKKGETISTFNFYFKFNENNKKPVVVLNNLQSGFLKIHRSENRKEKLEYLRKELNRLNKTLGENWRVYFTKKVNQLAKNKRLSFNPELPARFGLFGPQSSEKEYWRQLRQYLQTYIKAGVPLKNIDVSRVHEDFKEKIVNNIKNKKENIRKEKLKKEKQKNKKLNSFSRKK